MTEEQHSTQILRTNLEAHSQNEEKNRGGFLTLTAINKKRPFAGGGERPQVDHSGRWNAVEGKGSARLGVAFRKSGGIKGFAPNAEA